MAAAFRAGTVDGMLFALRFVIGAALAIAVLALTAVGLLPTARLTGHGKVGPIESSRQVPFDGNANWNQFYHADSARRFEQLARKREILQSGIEPSDGRPAVVMLAPVAAEAPAERPAEALLPAAAPLAAPNASVALVIDPSAAAAADEPRPRIVARQEDPFDARVETAAAEDERHDAAGQPRLVTTGELAAGAAVQPPIAVPADRLTPPADKATQNELLVVESQSSSPMANDAQSRDAEPASKHPVPSANADAALVAPPVLPAPADSDRPLAALPAAAPSPAPDISEPASRPAITDSPTRAEAPALHPTNHPSAENASTGAAAGEEKISETHALAASPTIGAMVPPVPQSSAASDPVTPAGPANLDPPQAQDAPAAAAAAKPAERRGAAKPAGKRARDAVKPAARARAAARAVPPRARVVARPPPRARRAAPLPRQAAPYDPFTVQQQFIPQQSMPQPYATPFPYQQHRSQQFPPQFDVQRRSGQR